MPLSCPSYPKTGSVSRPAFADRRLECKPGVPGKIDPGVLRHLGDVGVGQRPAHRLGVDGRARRARGRRGGTGPTTPETPFPQARARAAPVAPSSSRRRPHLSPPPASTCERWGGVGGGGLLLASRS